VALVTTLFGATLAAVLWDWHVRPPVSGLVGSDTYGRNIPGDLDIVLGWLAVEFVTVLVAVQPWRSRPRRRWTGLVGLLFVAWGVLRIMMALHAPPVTLPHDLLVLVLGLGLVLFCAASVLRRRRHDAGVSKAAT
jgi:hypothetical protein